MKTIDRIFELPLKPKKKEGGMTFLLNDLHYAMEIVSAAAGADDSSAAADAQAVSAR